MVSPKHLPKGLYAKQSGALVEWIEEIKARVRNDRDAVIAIVGPEREGKSTCAYHLARKIDSAFSVQSFSLTGKEFMRKIVEFPPTSAIIFDEIISGGYKREAMKKDNKELAKLGIVMGVKNQCVFLLAPDLDFIDSYFSKHRLHYEITIIRRGLAEINRLHKVKGADALIKEHIVTFEYPKADGPVWQEYLSKKAELVKTTGLGKSSQIDPSIKLYQTNVSKYVKNEDTIKMLLSMWHKFLIEVRSWHPPPEDGELANILVLREWRKYR